MQVEGSRQARDCTSADSPAAACLVSDNTLQGTAEDVNPTVTSSMQQLQLGSSRSSVQSDALREIRAMVNLALPAPPLPMIISRPLQDEAGFMMSDTQVCSSHDVIAGLQNAVCTLATKKQNRDREYLQIRLNADLMDKVDEWNAMAMRHPKEPLLPPHEWSYNVMCEFTRG